MEKERDHLIISGSGKVSGGTYHTVEIRGHGKVNGDLNCSSFTCQGSGRVEGSLKAESVRIHGSIDFKGQVQSEQLEIHGHAGIGDALTSKELSLHGHVSVRGNLCGEEMKIKGSARIKGDCEAETFSVKGGFSIDGLLNAGEIEIEPYRCCRVKEIGGEHIQVKKTGNLSLLNKVFSLFHASDGLTADIIEGDDIHLENTRAKVVRGDRVTIGAGCEIDRVEYRIDFRTEKDAVVRENQRI